LNRGCLEVWARLSAFLDPNSPSRLVYFTISCVSFQNCCLAIVEEKNRVQLEDVSCVFVGANVFNDTLPSFVYVDLTGVISKYELLTASRAGPLLQKWKTALEHLIVYYGRTEQQIMERLDTSNKIKKLLQIPAGTNQKVYQHNPSFELSFKLVVSTETAHQLKLLIKILSDNFVQNNRQAVSSKGGSNEQVAAILQRNADYKSKQPPALKRSISGSDNSKLTQANLVYDNSAVPRGTKKLRT